VGLGFCFAEGGENDGCVSFVLIEMYEGETQSSSSDLQLAIPLTIPGSVEPRCHLFPSILRICKVAPTIQI
jgi:hypothetical protein